MFKVAKAFRKPLDLRAMTRTKLFQWAAPVVACGICVSMAAAQPPGGGPGGPGSPGGPGGPGGPPQIPFMQALDLNSDGAIDQDEIALAADSLKTLDKDKDGKLTMQELMPPMRFRTWWSRRSGWTRRFRWRTRRWWL